MGIVQDVLWPSVLENAVIIAINIGLVAAAYFIWGWDLVALYGLIMLIEGATFMLIGGSMEFATSASGRAFVSFVTRKPNKTTDAEYRRAANRAGVFALVGVLLFVESLGLALLVA